MGQLIPFWLKKDPINNIFKNGPHCHDILISLLKCLEVKLNYH